MTIHRRVAASPWLVAFGLALQRSAAVAQPTYDPGLPPIDWDAPADCPDGSAIRDSVAHLLEDPLPQSVTRPIAFHGTVTRATDHFSLSIEIGPSPVHPWKTLEAETCQTLADTFALVIAFTLDPELASKHPDLADRKTALAEAPTADSTVVATAHPPTKTEPRTATTKPAAQPVVIERRQSPAPQHAHPVALAERRSKSHVSGGPFAAFGVGLLPFPAWAAGAAFAVDVGSRIQLSALYWPPREATIEDPVAGGVRTRLWSAELAVCRPLGSKHLGWCGGAQLGEMRAEGVDLPNQDQGASWWTALTLGVMVEQPLLPSTSVRGRLDLGVPVFRPQFVFKPGDGGANVSLFRPAAVFATLSLQAAVGSGDLGL